MWKLAAVGLAGLVAVGSLASAGTAEARSNNWAPFAIGAGIFALGAIAASQSYAYPHYYSYPYAYDPYVYDSYAYQPYYVRPRIVVTTKRCFWKNGVQYCYRRY